MKATLVLPSVLRTAVGADRIAVEGQTVGAALDAACAVYPNLRRHVLQETGALRPHVLCLLNGRSLPRTTFADHALADGDEILIHQAISGG